MLKQAINAGQLPQDAANTRAMVALDEACIGAATMSAVKDCIEPYLKDGWVQTSFPELVKLCRTALAEQGLAPPDATTYFELRGAIADLFAPQALQDAWWLDDEPDAEILRRLQRRLDACRHVQWPPGTSAAGDAPRAERRDIVRVLDGGGTASTQLVELTDGRRIAEKVSHDGMWHRLQFECRFQQEVLKATGGRWHPNVLRLYGEHETDGVQAVRMEFIDGPDGTAFSEALAWAVEQGIVTLAQADAMHAFVAVRLASALTFIHVAGWAHNDLKPANWVVDATGEPILLDFDAATALGQTAHICSGKFRAPERLAWLIFPAKVTTVTDSYSLGVALEELVPQRERAAPTWSRHAPLARFLEQAKSEHPDARPNAVQLQLHDHVALRATGNAEARALMRKIMLLRKPGPLEPEFIELRDALPEATGLRREQLQTEARMLLDRDAWKQAKGLDDGLQAGQRAALLTRLALSMAAS